MPHRPSFRRVISLLFVLQVTAAVAVTGWLAFRSGQRSAADIAGLLRSEVSARVQDSLSAYLAQPLRVNQLLVDAVATGELDPWDKEAVEQRIALLMRTFEDLGYVTLGDKHGHYVGVDRAGEGWLRLEVTPGHGVQVSRAWRLDEEGARAEEIPWEGEHYDPRVRPWYQVAVEADGVAWAEPYVWANGDALCLDSSRPVRTPDGDFVGVVDAGFTLTHVSQSLQQMQVGRSGRAFIVDRGGEVIASSADESVVLSAGRIKAVDIEDPLARAAARAVQRHLDLTDPDGVAELIIEDEAGPVHLQASPLRDPAALDWIIVVAIPERDFMGHAEASRRQTLLLCLIALVLANVLGVVVVRWIGRPLIELAHKARRIKTGDLEVDFVPRTDDEIGELTETMGEMVSGLREREFIREAFGRYVTPQLVDEVLREPDAAKPGGRMQTVTILMSDLRGFTALSARMQPSEMIGLLNRYLGRMTEVILAHGGMINEFIGDAILALFGAPHPAEDDVERALRCALAMQQALEELNEELEAAGIPRLVMGIGLNTGEVVVGNIGSDKRMKYGVVGDAVNLTARIEGLTVGSQVMISAETLAAAGGLAQAGPPLAAQVKGHDGDLVVHELFGVVGGPRLRRGAEDMEAVGRAVEARRVLGKAIDEEVLPMVMERASPKGAELRSPEEVEPFTDLVLTGEGLGQLYGKVTSCAPQPPEEGDQHRLRLAFTWLDPEDRVALLGS